MENDWIKKAIEKSGKEFNIIGKPDCYKTNNDPYPLCVGDGNDYCKYCCLYEDMEEPEM